MLLKSGPIFTGKLTNITTHIICISFQFMLFHMILQAFFKFQTQGCSKCRNIIPLFQNFSYKYQYLYLPPTRPRLFRFWIIFSCFLLLYWLFLFEILHSFLWNHSLFFNFYHYASLHFFYFCSMTCEQLLSLKVKVTSVLSSSLFLIHITFIRN